MNYVFKLLLIIHKPIDEVLENVKFVYKMCKHFYDPSQFKLGLALLPTINLLLYLICENHLRSQLFVLDFV